MKCDDIKDLILALHEGELDDALSREVRSHIDACEACAREERLCREVSLALEPLGVLTAPDTATARIMSEVAVLSAQRRKSESRIAAWGAVVRQYLGDTLGRGAVAWTAAACLVVAIAVGALGAAGYLVPETEEAGPIAAFTGKAATSARTVLAGTARRAGEIIRYEETVSGFTAYARVLPDVMPWFLAAVALVAVLLAASAAEERHIAARLRSKFADRLK